MNYQLNSGLEDDGVCGPDTLHALSLLGRRITGGSAHAIREREHVRAAGPQLAGKRVVIDPHLGGADKGALVDGPFGQITEEEILWDLAQRVEGRMIAAGVETIISRPRGDNPSCKERADLLELLVGVFLLDLLVLELCLDLSALLDQFGRSLDVLLQLCVSLSLGEFLRFGLVAFLGSRVGDLALGLLRLLVDCLCRSCQATSDDCRSNCCGDDLLHVEPLFRGKNWAVVGEVPG